MTHLRNDLRFVFIATVVLMPVACGNTFAPALNGETVFSRIGESGWEELTDIQLGDPPEHVFLPPPGAEIRERSMPFSKIPAMKR